MLRMDAKPPEFDELPDPLRSELAAMFRTDVQPAPAVDQAVLNRARALRPDRCGPPGGPARPPVGWCGPCTDFLLRGVMS